MGDSRVDGFPKTDLTLHIGSNKTGTTYVQGALAAGDGVQAEAGVGCPVVGRAKSGAGADARVDFLGGHVPVTEQGSGAWAAVYRKMKRRFHAENLELGRRYMAPEALACDDNYEVHEQSLPVSAAAVLVALWKEHLRAVDATAAPIDAPPHKGGSS